MSTSLEIPGVVKYINGVKTDNPELYRIPSCGKVIPKGHTPIHISTPSVLSCWFVVKDDEVDSWIAQWLRDSPSNQ